MGFDFFRKERTDIFEARFNLPTSPTEAYGLKSNLIFQAKNLQGKNFQITIDGQPVDLVATANGTQLLVTNRKKGDKPKIALQLTEDILAAEVTDKEKKGSTINKIAQRLFTDHTSASTHSPLISGCIVNNFSASSTYKGYKLHLKLNSRQPIINPWASGNEKEYFLIGQVLDTDCDTILLLGWKDAKVDKSCNELVNPFGSKIPRPARPAAG